MTQDGTLCVAPCTQAHQEVRARHVQHNNKRKRVGVPNGGQQGMQVAGRAAEIPI